MKNPFESAKKYLEKMTDTQPADRMANPAEVQPDKARQSLEDGEIIAVLIDSAIVGPVWFAFDDGLKSGDDVPVFFASELPHLRNMSEVELRRRYEEKRALGGGWIRDRIENKETCWNCGAAWSETRDLEGRAVRVCWTCAKGRKKHERHN
jgi:RNA polymerase-binding transcription factor DksA